MEVRQQEIEVAQLHMNSLIFLHLKDIKSLTRFQVGPSTVNHDLPNFSDASEVVNGVGATFSLKPYILEAPILNFISKGLTDIHPNAITIGPSTTDDTDPL